MRLFYYLFVTFMGFIGAITARAGLCVRLLCYIYEANPPAPVVLLKFMPLSAP